MYHGTLLSINLYISKSLKTELNAQPKYLQNKKVNKKAEL